MKRIHRYVVLTGLFAWFSLPGFGQDDQVASMIEMHCQSARSMETLRIKGRETWIRYGMLESGDALEAKIATSALELKEQYKLYTDADALRVARSLIEMENEEMHYERSIDAAKKDGIYRVTRKEPASYRKTGNGDKIPFESPQEWTSVQGLVYAFEFETPTQGALHNQGFLDNADHTDSRIFSLGVDVQAADPGVAIEEVVKRFADFRITEQSADRIAIANAYAEYVFMPKYNYLIGEIRVFSGDRTEERHMLHRIQNSEFAKSGDYWYPKASIQEAYCSPPRTEGNNLKESWEFIGERVEVNAVLSDTDVDFPIPPNTIVAVRDSLPSLLAGEGFPLLISEPTSFRNLEDLYKDPLGSPLHDSQSIIEGIIEDRSYESNSHVASLQEKTPSSAPAQPAGSGGRTSAPVVPEQQNGVLPFAMMALGIVSCAMGWIVWRKGKRCK